MHKIRDAGRKGLGVFATKYISRGTRILAERPLFSVKSERDVYAASKNVPAEDKAWLMHLSVDTNKPPSYADWGIGSWNLLRSGTLPTKDTVAHHQALARVFRNNNFLVGEGRQAIFRDICRINHSCVPNSQGNWNSAVGCFTIHAIQPIDPEEEITISYLDEHGAVKSARQRRLWNGYGFECTCPICDLSTNSGQKSEEKRAYMRQVVRENAERAAPNGEPDYKGQTQIIQSLIEMFENDGLAGRELATMYMAAAEGNVKIGAREEAKRCADAGLQLEEDCVGTDNPLFQESVQRMRPITGHWHKQSR